MAVHNSLDWQLSSRVAAGDDFPSSCWMAFCPALPKSSQSLQFHSGSQPPWKYTPALLIWDISVLLPCQEIRLPKGEKGWKATTMAVTPWKQHYKNSSIFKSVTQVFGFCTYIYTKAIQKVFRNMEQSDASRCSSHKKQIGRSYHS